MYVCEVIMTLLLQLLSFPLNIIKSDLNEHSINFLKNWIDHDRKVNLSKEFNETFKCNSEFINLALKKAVRQKKKVQPLDGGDLGDIKLDDEEDELDPNTINKEAMREKVDKMSLPALVGGKVGLNQKANMELEEQLKAQGG